MKTNKHTLILNLTRKVYANNHNNNKQRRWQKLIRVFLHCKSLFQQHQELEMTHGITLSWIYPIVWRPRSCWLKNSSLSTSWHMRKSTNIINLFGRKRVFTLYTGEVFGLKADGIKGFFFAKFQRICWQQKWLKSLRKQQMTWSFLL